VHYGPGAPLGIEDATEDIVGGMSGSPILDSVGKAIGVLCTSGRRPRRAVVSED